MRLLIIEDNEVVCQNIASVLKTEGYEVDYCLDGQEGLEYALCDDYNLILLDRLLPYLDGTSLLKQIRQKGISTPVIMVTALGQIDDKVAGLDAGADDYITKPFSMKELLARVRALCRRPPQIKTSDIITHNDISFDKLQLLLTGPKSSCTLSKRESSLMELFLDTPNRLLPRHFIYSKVWGVNSFVEDGNIDNYIRFLRRRLIAIGSTQKIKTVRGMGYILEDQDATEA